METRAECLPKGHADSIAQALALCFTYEAFKIVEGKTNFSFVRAFRAFELLGRVKTILGERYEEVKSEVYEKTKVRLLAIGYPEDALNLVVEVGIELGEARPLPIEIGGDHYEFFADIVLEKLGYRVRYTLFKRWEVWDGRRWKKQPYWSRITLFIYHVLSQKIAIWREALKAGAANADLEKWLEELEEKIKTPWWLKKVEEALLGVERFRGIVIV